MMPSNKRFTNWITPSVLEIRSPHFYARPSQAQAVQKRSGFIFPSTDRVTQLVNRYQNFYKREGVKESSRCRQYVLTEIEVPVL